MGLFLRGEEGDGVGVHEICGFENRPGGEGGEHESFFDVAFQVVLHEIPVLRGHDGGEDEVLEDVAWSGTFVYGGVDHVEAHFFLSRVEGWADVEDGGHALEQALAG